jgi:cytochrome c553
MSFKTGCEGKRAFASFSQAEKGASRARKDGRNTAPYHCPHCHRFHTGGRPEGRLKRPLKVLNPVED